MEDLVMAAKSGQYDIISHRRSLFKKMLIETECCDDYYFIGEAIKRYNDKIHQNFTWKKLT